MIPAPPAPPVPASATARLLAEIAAASPATTPPHRLADLRRRARALGRTDCLPAWLTSPSPVSPAAPDSPTTLPAAANATLHAKADAHRIPYALLRAVYRRAVRPSPPSPTLLPLTREQQAQARVNAFIRATQGDPTATTQDADLLQYASRAV